MDFLLPDDETIALMNEEYSKERAKNASIFALNTPVARPRASITLQTVVFALYIARVLRYNARYGTEVYDSHGSVGRIQPNSSTFGIVNHLKHG